MWSVATTYKPADASTAGFGGSFAGEDGIARVDEATNPDVRERIGAGTASQMAPAPTGGPHTYASPASLRPTTRDRRYCRGPHRRRRQPVRHAGT